MARKLCATNVIEKFIERYLNLMIDKIFLVLLCVLPFSHFLFKQVDIWTAHGTFLQLGILLLYCLHIFKKNKPLASLLFWVGLVTISNWIGISVKTKNYPILVFLPFFNFLCMVVLYNLITEYLKKEHFEKIIKYFFYSVLVVLGYCLLQKLNLDQFYKNLENTPKDELVGTIGNPMHLAHFLAITLPFLFRNKLAVILSLFVILLTGSVSGLFIAVCVLLFYSLFYKIFTLREIILTGILGILFFIFKYKNLNGIIQNFSFSSGRFEIWQKLYPMFAQKSITGWGLGIMNAIGKQQEFLGWRHTHFEYYHYAIEIGLIGVGLIIWGIVDYFRRFKKAIKDEITVKMVAVFVGFLISGLFGYPSHLWLLSSLGMLSYSFIYVVKNEVNNGG